MGRVAYKKDLPLTREEQDFVEAYLPLIKYAVKKSRPRNADEGDDWIQEGAIAAVRARRSYDPTKGTKLSFWTYLYVRRRIQNYKHSYGLITLPRVITPPNKSFAYQARSLRHLDPHKPDYYGLCTKQEESNHDHLDEALARLRARDRNVIVLYFYQSKNLREIAGIYQCSHQYVSQLLRKALEKLKAAYLKLEGSSDE